MSSNETKIDVIDIERGILVNPNWAYFAKEGKDTGKCLNCIKCMWHGMSNVYAGKVIFEEILKKNSCTEN